MRVVLISIVGTAYVDVRAKTDNFGSDIESKTSSIAKKAAAIFAGAFVLEKGVTLFKGFLDEANEARKVTAQVEQVIKSTGGVANVSAKDVDTLANSISRKSGIDDEAIASSQALLLTFTNIRSEVGKGNDIFAQATQAVADMSAVQGDLSSNSILVGKALQDPILGLTALQRVGVRLTEQQKEQVKAMVEVGNVAGAQKVILAELATEFGGQAAAQATAGEKLTVTIDNIREAIGTRLLPIVDAFATFMADKLPGAFDWASVKISEFVAAVTPTLTQWGDKAREIFERLQPVIKQVADFIGDNLKPILFGIGIAIGLLIGPITGTILVLGLLYARFQVVRDGVQFVIEVFKDLVAWVSAQVPKIETIISGVVKGVSFLWSTFGEFISRSFREAWELVKRVVETAITVVSRTIELVLDLLTGKWGAAWNAAKDIVGAVMGLIRDAVMTALRIVIDQVLSAVEALLRLGSHLPIVGGKFKGLADDVDRFRDRVNASLGGVETKAVAAANTVIGSVRAMETAMGVAAKLAATNPVANESMRALERASENAGPKFFAAGKKVGNEFVKGAGAAVKGGGKKVAEEAAKAAEAAAKKATERLSAVFAGIRAALGLTDARQDLAAALGEQAALGAEQASLPAQIAAAQARLAAAVADSRAATAEEQVAIEDARAALDEAEAKAAGGADVAAKRAEAALRLAELQSKALEDQADRTDAIAKATRELADAQANLTGERGKEPEKQDPTRLRELDQRVADQQAALVKLKGLDAAASAKAATEQAAATAELRKAEAAFANGSISAAALQVARNNLTRAIRDAGGPNEDAQSAAEELADLQARQRDIGNELTDVTKRITQATLSLAESQRGANDALKDWKDAAPSQLGIFRDIATQAGLTKDQIDGLIKSIGTLATTAAGTIKVAPFVPPNLQTAEQILGGAFTGGPTYNLAITGATLQPLDEEAIVEYQRRIGVLAPI